MLRTVVTLATLFQMLVPSQCTRLIPVYDIRTKERFAFQEDFLKLVLEYQSPGDDGESTLYIPEQLDDEGYIINENGDLVPFRLYKKGGSRLHPRNCRGGFHKRLSADPVPEEISRDLYGLQVYTPKHKRTENTDKFDTSYRLDSSDIFDPGYDEQSMEDLNRPSKYKDRSNFKTAELGDALYGIFPSLKSEHFKNDLNLIGLSETDMETLNDMKEATLLLDDLSKGLEQVAEPPPLETESRVKAKIEEYPAYELMEDYDRRYRDNVDRHTEDISVYSPADTADIYAFRKRM